MKTMFSSTKNRVNLKPSVLKIEDNIKPSSSASKSTSTSSSVSSSNDANKVFKFAPLTDTASSTSTSFLPTEVTSQLNQSQNNTNNNHSRSDHNDHESKEDDEEDTKKPSSGQPQSLVTSSTSVSPKPSETTCDPDKAPRFVFGQNLEERAIVPENDGQTSPNGHANDENSKDVTSSKTQSQESVGSTSSADKRKFEAITGEEDESNVLQIYSKLYLWESETSIWKEKGKGLLRLNDKMKDDKMCSRLVMRTSGSLRVILNTPLVTGMKFEHSSERCLRFTNIEGIYLLKGKEKDIDQLRIAVEYRLRELTKRMKTEELKEPDSQEDVSSSSTPQELAN